MTEPTEEWSWSKFFSGFISGRRYGKDHAILFRMALIVVFWACVVMGILWAKDRFLSPKAPDKLPTIINSGGAPVDNSVKKSDFTFFKFGGTDN